MRIAGQRIGRVISLTAIAIACSSDSQLRPFTSDGCSLFPDSSPISAHDWCSCCFEHDLAYWRGGTSEERATADLLLEDCVLQKTGDESFAKLMYAGVRAGGSPYFYNRYRWGYGWRFDRKYQSLTPKESEIADGLVEEYFTSIDGPLCASE